MQITPLPDLGITVVSRWIFNCYVVHDGGEGRPFLVDPGLPSITRAALRVVADLGRDPRNVAALVATHGHSDHVGGIPDGVGLTGAPVALPARTHDYLAGEAARTPGARQVAKIWPVFLDQRRDLRALGELGKVSKTEGYGQAPMKLSVDPGEPLVDGAPVPGAPDWQAIHAPGHVDDATVFHRASTGTLLSGDTILSAAGRAWFNPEYVDAGLSAKTEERLRELGAEHVLPGHGRPVLGPAAIEDARSFTETGLGSVVSSCRAWARWLAGR